VSLPTLLGLRRGRQASPRNQQPDRHSEQQQGQTQRGKGEAKQKAISRRSEDLLESCCALHSSFALRKRSTPAVGADIAMTKQNAMRCACCDANQALPEDEDGSFWTRSTSRFALVPFDDLGEDVSCETPTRTRAAMQPLHDAPSSPPHSSPEPYKSVCFSTRNKFSTKLPHLDGLSVM